MNIGEMLSGGDILVGLAFGLAVILGGLVIWSRAPDRAVILGALVAKLLSCYLMCAMTIFVFQGGDMDGYHNHGIIYSKLLENDLTTGSTDYFTTTPFFVIQHSNTERCRSFSGLVHFFTLNSYVASSVVFAVIGFLGQYYLYRTFASAYPSPRVRIWWTAGILYMPSLTFWSAGLLKDPLGLWGLGYTVWGGYTLLRMGRYSGIIRIALGTYVMLLFRAQTAPVSMLALAPLLLSTKRSPGAARMSGGGRVVRVAVRLCCLLAFAGVFAYSAMIDRRADYSNIQDALANERNNYAKVSGGGSTVMGEAEPVQDSSVLGLLRLWPESMLFCLFRPYLWESFRSPVMILAGLETTTLLVLMLRAAFLALIRPRALAASLGDPLFLSCLIFVGLFGFALGVSTPNLGTISRYRLPVIPFFMGALAIFEYHRLEQKLKQKVPYLRSPSTFPGVEARRPAPHGGLSGFPVGD